jgi:tRNA (cytidine56-2'-O)-methyltransferase
MITVLRYGHRPGRDKRATTHVGLVARAFGAGRFLLAAEDDSVVESLQDVADKWGGSFRVGTVANWRSFLKNFKGVRVHLTMYGLPLDKVAGELRNRAEREDVLVFVGAEKVPPEVYQLCEYNVAVGSQPHSEIAALALFLDRIFDGKELDREFEGAELQVVPQERGKKVRKA